jgi:hypothetical protein
MDERKTLFNQFLKDKSTYNLNIGYWRRKLQTALQEKLTPEKQLINNRDDKGKNLYDGNPIFSYYNRPRNKAIRIIQEDPSELTNYSEVKLIQAWFDKITIPISRSKEKEVDELVISIFLTHTSVERCLIIVRAWKNNILNENNLQSYLK